MNEMMNTFRLNTGEQSDVITVILSVCSRKDLLWETMWSVCSLNKVTLALCFCGWCWRTCCHLRPLSTSVSPWLCQSLSLWQSPSEALWSWEGFWSEANPRRISWLGDGLDFVQCEKSVCGCCWRSPHRVCSPPFILSPSPFCSPLFFMDLNIVSLPRLLLLLLRSSSPLSFHFPSLPPPLLLRVWPEVFPLSFSPARPLFLSVFETRTPLTPSSALLVSLSPTSPLYFFKKRYFHLPPRLTLFLLYLSGVLHIVLLHIVIPLSLPHLTSASFVLCLLSHHLLTFSSLVFASFSSCLPSLPSSCFHCFSGFNLSSPYHDRAPLPPPFTVKTLSLSLPSLVPLFVSCFSRPHPSSDVFFMVYLPSFCSPLLSSHTCDLPVTFSNLFNSLLLSPMRFLEILFVLDRLPRSSPRLPSFSFYSILRDRRSAQKNPGRSDPAHEC